MTVPAPWSPLFHSHIAHLRPPTFVLSTLHHSPSRTPPYTPRARTCIFRGMLGSAPRNTAAAVGTQNTAPKTNPPTISSDLLTFTTDVRSGKVPDLLGATATAAADARASGGGGLVEAVFYVEAVKTQWRVRGDAWVIGPDIEGGGVGAQDVKRALRGRMRGDEEGWSWERERIAQFWGLGPELRKRFGGETPGTVIRGEDRDADDEEAKENFRVVVVRPAEVECLDFTDEDNAKRWIYTFVEKEAEGVKGSWVREELYP